MFAKSMLKRAVSWLAVAALMACTTTATPGATSATASAQGAPTVAEAQQFVTDAEAQLAEALVKGATLADFAQEREVSKQTLRNQLVGVMRKTQTRRQSELVSLLTRLAVTCL